jgi:malonate transporter and related proteins
MPLQASQLRLAQVIIEHQTLNAIIQVILPVFLVMGMGYAAARAKLLSGEAVDGIMRYAQNFAVPFLLFRSIAGLDLTKAYDVSLLLSFYLAAFASFAVGLTGALFLFRRSFVDAVAIGFACMFSNSLLLGLPITERAYGVDALDGNFVIISIHAPLLYTFGITLMEIARARGKSLSGAALGKRIIQAVATQPLVIGIAAGFIVNLSGVHLPDAITSTVSMMAATAIPAALFGLGGVLTRYSLEGDKATIAMICGCSLVLHPGIAYLLGHWGFGLNIPALRSTVVTAAMAPGVNAYLFANYYGVAKRVNAAAVLVATTLSIGTISMWLWILP